MCTSLNQRNKKSLPQSELKSGDSIEFLIFSLLLLFSTNCFQYLRCHIILIHINHVIFFSKHEIFWIKTAHNIIADSHFFYLVSRRRKNHSKRKKRKTCFSDKAKMLYYRFRKCQFDVFIPYVLFSSANIFGVSPNIFFNICVFAAEIWNAKKRIKLVVFWDENQKDAYLMRLREANG